MAGEPRRREEDGRGGIQESHPEHCVQIIITRSMKIDQSASLYLKDCRQVLFPGSSLLYFSRWLGAFCSCPSSVPLITSQPWQQITACPFTASLPFQFPFLFRSHFPQFSVVLFGRVCIKTYRPHFLLQVFYLVGIGRTDISFSLFCYCTSWLFLNLEMFRGFGWRVYWSCLPSSHIINIEWY